MPVLGAASSTPTAATAAVPPFLIGSLVYWGGSSIGTATWGHLRQMYGTTGTNGNGGGLWGGHLALCTPFGKPGCDSNDSLGSGGHATPRSGDVVTHIDAMTNDMKSGFGNATLHEQFKDLWRANFAKLRSSVRYSSEDAAWAYGGTWVLDEIAYQTSSLLVAGNGFWPNGKRRSSTVAASTATFTVPAGVTAGWVELSGIDDTPAGYAGSTFSISGAGLASPVTGTTSNRASTTSLYQAHTSTIVVKLTGLTPGGSLVVTKTGAAGKLSVEGFLVPSATPSTVIVTKPYPTGDPAISNSQRFLISSWTPHFDAVVLEYVTAPYTQTDTTGDKSIIVFDPALAGFDGVTMSTNWDVHPNSYGHRKMREAWEEFLAPVNVRGTALF